MKRTTWLRKALWIFPIVLLVLVGAASIALRSYLSSAAAVQQVAQRLQEMLGGRVEIEGAQIGLIGDSSVRGIQVYEADKPNKPWLSIDDVRADVSALGLLLGKSPQAIHLQGAHLTLRFDSDGNLLTKLPTKKKAAPEQLPQIHIASGELTLDQQHRTPMMIRGVKAEIVSGDKGMTLTGTVSEPLWGDWKAKGDFNSTGAKGSLTLAAESIAMTMPKLKALPFVPPSVWQEIEVEGTTPARLDLDVETSGDQTSVHYRVEISPKDARVRVPSIDLEAVQADCKAVIADEIIEVEKAHGKTAGGSILASGKLNFHDEPTRLALKASVQDVLLHDLPPSWKVPHDLDGKLTGSADLVVTLKQGKIETEGSGEGLIRDATWGHFAAEKPVRLTLHSENGRFHFHQPEPMSGVASAPRENAETQTRANYPIPNRRRAAIEEIKLDEEGGLLRNAPAELVNLLGHGIKAAADGLAKGIDAAAKGLKKIKPPSKPGEEPTYLDIDLNLQNVDLAQLVQKLKLNLPYAVTGRLTFQVHASIPINTAADLKAYRLRGTAKLESFNVSGLAMTNVEAKVRYANGVLDLENLSGRMPAANDRSHAERGNEDSGKFDGSARVEVVPRGDLQASLNLDRLPMGTLLSLAPGMKEQVSGILSGKVQARAPLMKLNDAASWRGSANLSVPNVKVYGVPLNNASASLIVDEARARLSTFKADFAGAPLTGEAELRLQGNYPFKAEVHLGSSDLKMLNRLAPAFRPPFTLTGRTQLEGTASGTLKPLQFDTRGRLHARDLVVERFTVDDLSFRWSKDKDDLKLDTIKMSLYGGGVTGSARLPLSTAAPGSANLDIRDLDVKAMAKALPAFPVKLEGKISGTAKGTLSAAEKDRPRTWTSELEVTAPELRVQGVPAEKLKGTIDSRAGKTSYNLQGETLGGTFTIKGDLPVPAKEEEKKPQARSASDGRLNPSLALRACAFVADEPIGKGRFELSGARLSRLWRAYNITGGLANLNGRFSIFLDYQHAGPNLAPIGNGDFRIINISWGDDYLGSSLQGNVRLTANSLQLDNVSGDLAGGLFFGQFLFGLTANARGWFQIDLQQVEASRLLRPLPAVAANVKGPVDINLRGSISREWDGSGGITLVRSQIYGMDITEWRIPLTFSFSPSDGSGELTVRDSHARLAQGRANFDGAMHWGNGLRLTGRLLYYQVDLRTLMRSSPEMSSYASGRVSGRIDLAGSEMRSLNDLTARVQARMEQGQAMQMPVLRAIVPYLRPRAQTATFQRGDLKGRLANGIFRIEHASLVGDFIKLLILGTVNLAGNLDLDVTAQTGLYCLNPARTNSISSRIPLIGAIPRLVLYEASSLLSAAVVHLSVTGTVRAPVVRLEPLLTLTEDAVRFFLGRAIGQAIPNLP
jgi:translocation and assembly module TamB